eukprot:CAMPEP_0173103270 /NCGR_PEP_ID=MMETSP1102-20130122/38239_1 /TAXON_ID=49646 /ORGANISM="Geminigera sp., Strain Caron Lab Isolate" /LENGTH=300 /DNA_ID=CAMNT_0013997951 /DNA_START=85 /DNA_END=983 /DNA_ORIENTATION=+
MKYVREWQGLGPRIEATHLVPTWPSGPKMRLPVRKNLRLEHGWHDLPEDWTISQPTRAETLDGEMSQTYLQKFNGHVLTNMRKRRHLESHECVSPVGGMFHWNFFSVDPASDACLTHKAKLEDPSQPPQRSPMQVDNADCATERSHATSTSSSYQSHASAPAFSPRRESPAKSVFSRPATANPRQNPASPRRHAMVATNSLPSTPRILTTRAIPICAPIRPLHASSPRASLTFTLAGTQINSSDRSPVNPMLDLDKQNVLKYAEKREHANPFSGAGASALAQKALSRDVTHTHTHTHTHT